MSDRKEFTVKIECPGCEQSGVVIWEESGSTGRQGGSQRKLKVLSAGFHTRDIRTQSGDPQIICSKCGTIQPD